MFSLPCSISLTADHFKNDRCEGTEPDAPIKNICTTYDIDLNWLLKHQVAFQGKNYRAQGDDH